MQRMIKLTHVPACLELAIATVEHLPVASSPPVSSAASKHVRALAFRLDSFFRVAGSIGMRKLEDRDPKGSNGKDSAE